MDTPQLCNICGSKAITNSIREVCISVQESFTTNPSTQPDTESEPLKWHTNLKVVAESSKTCLMCRLILQGLRESRHEWVEDNRFSEEWFETPKDLDDDILDIANYSEGVLQLRAIAWRADEFELTSSGVEREGVGKILVLLRVVCNGQDTSSWSGYGPAYAELRVASTSGVLSSETQVPISRTITTDPASEQTFNQLKSWLSTCNTSHKECTSAQKPTFRAPTRLLNVGIDGESITLEQVGTETTPGIPYIALSHSWGKSPTYITTTENLPDRQSNIPISAMPQTFQDSVRITRGLGLQYIWIDSLCIIQNDAADWATEAARMASVYRDAHLVIGASNSSADSEGYLHPRVTPTIYLFGDNLQTTLLPPKDKRLNSTSDPVSLEPLSSRAWTLQERYLPHRMLSYGTSQIFWECACMAASETGDYIPRNGDRLGAISQTANINATVWNMSGASPSDTNRTNYFHWYAMLREYSRRDITKTKDRLPALAGMAAAMAEVTRDRYHVGIWEKGLIEGLLWSRSDGMFLRETDAYRAPSWSWASLEGPLNFSMYYFYERCRWKSTSANFEAMAEYVDSSLQFSTKDVFGGVDGGWLSLRGPLLPVLAVRRREKISYEPSGFMDILLSTACDFAVQVDVLQNGGSQKFWLDGSFDTEGNAARLTDDQTRPSGRKLFVLLLARLPNLYDEDGVFVDVRFGLILEKVEGEERYRRVGITDGTIKVSKMNVHSIISRMEGKLDLEPWLLEQAEVERVEEMLNTLAPDPWGGVERTTVVII